MNQLARKPVRFKEKEGEDPKQENVRRRHTDPAYLAKKGIERRSAIEAIKKKYTKT
jgi:hypothetical protein